jgi:hypothetical protein
LESDVDRDGSVGRKDWTAKKKTPFIIDIHRSIKDIFGDLFEGDQACNFRVNE